MLTSYRDGQIVELAGDFGVVVAEHGHFRVEPSSKEDFGVQAVTASEAAAGEVAQVDGLFIPVGWAAVLEDCESAFEGVLGFVDAPQVQQGSAEDGDVLSDEDMVGPELLLPHGNSAGRRHHRLGG